MTKAYQGLNDRGQWEQFEWDDPLEPTPESTGYDKVEEIGGTIEFHTCFFCEKNKVEFRDGRGQVALGEKQDGSEFGAHPHCGCLSK